MQGYNERKNGRTKKKGKGKEEKKKELSEEYSERDIRKEGGRERDASLTMMENGNWFILIFQGTGYG